MKVTILHKRNSETDTRVESYMREFQNRTGKKLEMLDAETPRGVDVARLHDILQFPAILVTQDDGGYMQSWTELEKWPTISELSFYAQ